VTTRLRSSRRIASVAVVMIGLLGACAVLVVLVESPGSSGAPGRSGPVLRHRRLAPAALKPAVITPADRTGARLMTEAAAACGSVAFRGTQVAVWWGSTSDSASFLQVWHRPGGAILAQPANTAANTAANPPDEGQPEADALQDFDEVMTVTVPLLTLMRANYVLTYSGRAAADGRPAQVVEVRRRDGGLAARFWLDTATKLPLQRELFDGKSRIFSRDAFIGLSVGPAELRGMPDADAQPWTGQLSAGGLTALRAAGWPLPRAVASGLTLFKATETSTNGRVVELSYSDGLSVISVFLQRGELPRSLPGWQRLTARGNKVYATDPDDRSLAWSSRGFVYTVISDAPTAAIDQAVMRLPHDSPAGFWERMSRGFRRMVSWANPFR
jgi:sigma-E factor negative regulatory protein RseB